MIALYPHLLIGLFSLVLSSIHAMNIHAWHLDLFSKEQVPTEYYAYKSLVAHPLPQSVTYVAVPWVVLLNENRLHELPDIHVQNGFTICQHIRYYDLIPTLEKIGVTVLFTPHVQTTRHHGSVTVLPFPHYPVNSIEPTDTKDILYSFIGTEWTHKFRSLIFKMPHCAKTYIKKRATWHFYNNAHTQALQRTEYVHVLARSRYSLCPPGTGPSTIRFWESLRSGAIPILLSDTMQLPHGFDWSSCVLYVNPQELHRLPEILAALSPEQEEHMRHAALAAYHYFIEDDFAQTIRDYFAV